LGATHDHFRGKTGAFDKAVAAFRNCKAVGQKVGLRLTLSRHNIADLDGILDFIEREDIERVCFYHLVYSGRGSELMEVPHE
jgi:MoaA/NifB/PqqE/SkfB family radical SAM enzyme